MIVLRKQKLDKKKRKNDDEVVAERIKINHNAKSRSFDLGNRLMIHFDDPLRSADFTHTQFISGTDTTCDPPFQATDSIMRHFVLDGEIAEEKNYDFIFPDSSFYSIYGITNDSTRLSFKAKAAKEYGNILVDVELATGEFPYLLQLLTPKGEVLREKLVAESSVVTFMYVLPGKYMLKAIGDKWNNRKWDTGNYFLKRQPENALFIPAEIEVRANWDIEKSWSLP
jgi:hypothetical protein